MSWFKRKNEALNGKVGEEKSSSAGPMVCGRPATLKRAYEVATGAPLTDTERLGYDAVNLPEHYKMFEIEPMLFCQANNLDPLQTAINKYTVRFRYKNGTEDLRKAARCLDMLIAFEEGDPDWWKLPGERTSRRTYII